MPERRVIPSASWDARSVRQCIFLRPQERHPGKKRIFAPFKNENGMTRQITHTCVGTCSRQIDIVVDDDTIRSVVFTGGCHGNTQGVAALVRGMKVGEAIARLEGIDCRGRGTSCPDQLARALRQTL